MFITATIIMLLLSILLQIIIGVLYQRIINETDNMQTTENKLLKQCKLKFTNCYQLNMGVTNIPIFVDKFINKISICGLKMSNVSHLSGQLMLLSVLLGGMGACKGIIEGETIGDLLPYYIISILGLYVYFSVTSLIDIPNKKVILKTNLIDYLENHMVNRLRATKVEMAQQKEVEKEFQQELQQKQQKIKKDKPVFFTKSEEEELEELLKEFLT